MNEAILKKVQAIYGAPSLESVNPMKDTEVFDETPALEAYSEEELELLHQELVEEYTEAMESVTAELANLELTIMLESVGLSLNRFNEYDGELSMEGVKNAVKAGKVTKDSAFKSILKRIVDMFWTMVDYVTGNYINVLKYGKLVQKYLKRLEGLNLSDKEFEFKRHLTVDADVFSKIVEENTKTMKKFAGFGKSGNDPKANMTYIYSIFKDLGINPSGAADSYTVHFNDRIKAFKEGTKLNKNEATVIQPNELKTKLIENGKLMIKALNSIAIKGFRDQVKAAKAKLRNGVDTTSANLSDEQKKSINADLKRCMALISAYKSYNKACVGIVKKNVNDYLTGVGAFIDAANNAAKKNEAKKEEK